MTDSVAPKYGIISALDAVGKVVRHNHICGCVKRYWHKIVCVLLCGKPIFSLFFLPEGLTRLRGGE